MKIWLVNADLAVARVAERVSQGGHAIPEATIRQRYHRGIRNFFQFSVPWSAPFMGGTRMARPGRPKSGTTAQAHRDRIAQWSGRHKPRSANRYRIRTPTTAHGNEIGAVVAAASTDPGPLMRRQGPARRSERSDGVPPLGDVRREPRPRWKVYDNTQVGLPQLVAHGDQTNQEAVLIDAVWQQMQQEALS
jgi:hypothetical protein